MDRASRFKEIRTYLNLSQVEFGHKLDISNVQISHIESNSRDIQIDTLNKLLKMNVNIDWLLTGEGEMFRGEGVNTCQVPSLVPKEEICYVRKLDIHAAAGVGIINYADGEVPIWVGLPASFIYPYSPSSIALLNVHGASMEPTMRHGDVLLVSEQDTSLMSEHIYIIRIGEELKVKRVDKLPNKNIVIWSDNPQYGRHEYTPQEWEEYGIEIVARVIKVIKNV
ncbi:MAG: XRE family transcriptional regulator [Brevinema sp.]